MEPSQQSATPVPRIGPALVAVAVLAAAAAYVVPRAADALDGLDDPARIANHALDDKFDAAVAQREIEAALAANDADLAQSFVDLAAAGMWRSIRRWWRRSKRQVPRQPPRGTKPKASRAASSPANRTTWLPLRAPRSAISSCSAISAMRCAKERGWRWGRKPMSWCSVWLPPELRSQLPRM